MGAARRPTLWHIPVSHYSEKARWALDFKGIAYEGHTPLPGAHVPLALWLTRGAQPTLPVIELEGRRIGDSSAIIAALEEHRPEPPLYPEDPAERSRALELEDFFDEGLGPDVRLLVFHELRKDPEALDGLTRTLIPSRIRDIGPVAAAGRSFGSAFSQLRYRVADDEAAAQARDGVLSALARLDRELERSGGEYLVGDRFTVADLTAAALFYPLVDPPEGPRVIPVPPAALERFRAPLRERPGYRWVELTYARHRRAAVAAVA